MNDIFVININGNLMLGGGQSISFVGDPGDVFVINVTGTVSLGGTSVLGSLATASRTILNVLGGGNQGTINAAGTFINATVLLPNATMVQVHNVNGGIFSGFGTVTLPSSAIVNGISFVPEPGTYLTAALILLPLGASTLRVFRKR